MKILDVPQSGSVAGVTASRNRFGQYRRTRAIPVQPRSPKQTYVRGQLTIGSSAWRTLSDPSRTAWNDYAAQITRSDGLGSGYSPTGASLYAATAILAPGLTVNDPPNVLPTYVLGVLLVSYTDPTPGPEALDVTLDTTSPDNQVLIETSGPVSPGITSAAAVRRWRSLPDSAANLAANRFSMAATPLSILTEYKRLYPSPVPGQSIWFRFTEIFFDGVNNAGITNHQHATYRLIVV